MKLESLSSSLFVALGRDESALVIGGASVVPIREDTFETQPTGGTIWSNTFVNGTYVGNDKDIITD